MFFFFKRKKIVVDCFTDNYSINELFPIQTANNFYPDWWKNLPKTYDAMNKWGLRVSQSTMKKCPAIIDLYKTGFIMPLWSDLQILSDDKNIK